MACDPEKLDDAQCLDATEPDIVGGPTGDAKQDACCGGGSACGWTYCEALDKCVQEWETPCPPASTATEPGVVNYFPDAQVAAQANTDCTGGEGVGIGCASGTTLSTENEYSGEGESTGEAVKHSTTATTVEAANAADKPSTKTPIINTAGGVASQSGGRASDGIYTTGSATVRDGAGNAKYIPGRK